jgi:hypothetical protein
MPEQEIFYTYNLSPQTLSWPVYWIIPVNALVKMDFSAAILKSEIGKPHI